MILVSDIVRLTDFSQKTGSVKVEIFREIIKKSNEKEQITEIQIIFAVTQAETGEKVEEVCSKMGISEATYYNWKKKFGGLGITELRRLRQLKEENSRLKKLVVAISLNNQILQHVVKKNF